MLKEERQWLLFILAVLITAALIAALYLIVFLAAAGFAPKKDERIRPANRNNAARLAGPDLAPGGGQFR